MYPMNGLGQRMAKISAVPGVSTAYFLHDEAGRLRGEYQANGTPIQEYVWMDEMLVGILKPEAGVTEAYWVETDHLGSPRLVRDKNQAVRWRWDGEPFGATLPVETPTAGLPAFTLNLRFPGQYYDKESGLHYNVARDYDPNTGRYVQADPIGLAGGINPYSTR